MEIQKHNYDRKKAERRVRVMEKFWMRMCSIFGAQWTRAYQESGGPIFQEWCRSLDMVTEEQIARGIKWCENDTREFPPTMPQFIQMCATPRPEEKPNFTEKRMQEEKDAGMPSSLIEHLSRSATSDVAKHELGKMRRILAGEDVETKQESYDNLHLNRRWGGRVDESI